MTVPLGGVFDMPPINIDGFCCADPIIGGCSHPGSTHTGPNGECRGVFGCNCRGFKQHKAKCIHKRTPEEVGG